MLQILGMLLSAAEPAAAVWAAGKSMERTVHVVDEKVLPRIVPPELLKDDDAGYFLHQLQFNPADQKKLCLPKSTWTILLSDEELGAYVRCEGVVLSGFEDDEIPKARRELKQLLVKGERRRITASQVVASQ